MKVVIDTNVFVSGIFFSGPPYQILRAWRNQEFQIVISLEILDEYARVGDVLSDQFPDVDLEPALKFFCRQSGIDRSATAWRDHLQ